MRILARQPRHAAFTLFEIMIAVVIVAMMMLTVYRFVQSNLTAIRISTEISEEKQSLTGLVNFIQDQLNNLPPGNPNVLTGEFLKINNLRGDRMEWISRAGEGVLTEAAPDEYRVTLTLERVGDTDEMAIGIRRRLVDEDIKNSKFMPLLRNAVAFKVRYFDRRRNGYSENWRYPDAKPWLVEVSIWREGDEQPHIAVLRVPGANTQM